jgi:predicted Zn finger-like uncharacterized protein
VIITCERCETEFQLDDARVPVSGARVRCSRCKHAFFVLPPAASRDQVIEQAASEALADDPTPPVTEDLVDAAGAHAGRPRSEPARGEDSESDWQFNRDLPADPGDSFPDLQATGFGPVEDDPEPPEQADDPIGASGIDTDADSDPESDRESDAGLELDSDREPEPARPYEIEQVRAPAPEPKPAASEDLGSPMSWDFFDKPERVAPVAEAAAQRASAPATLMIPFEETPESEPARRGAPLALRRAADIAGWIAVAALCAVALVRGLTPRADVSVAFPDPAPGLVLENVEARWLDNASLGRLYVVSGRVLNRTSDTAAVPPLALELRDASGRALGEIPLRGAGPPELLREANAAALATAGSELPGGLAAGVGWDFAVVAWPLPAEATRFAIRARS